MKARTTIKDVSVRTSLADCVALRSGKTPARNRADFWNGDVPWFSAKDLKSFRLNDSEEHITGAALADGVPMALAGELLILVRGMTLMKDVPLGVLQRDASFNQDLKSLTPREDIGGIYLGYMLEAAKPQLKAMVDKAGHGTGRLAIERLVSLPIWVPAPNCQTYVASGFQLLDNALQRYQALIDAKRVLKRGLMQQLLTGQQRFPEFRGRPWVKSTIGAMLKEVQRPVVWNEAATYTLVSVRRRSGGLFLREKKKGAEIKVKSLYTIRDGDILISTRQVVHGAIARVPAEFDGAHVSGEYMTLVPGKGAAISTKYFDHLSRLPRMYHASFLASYGVDIEKLTFNSEWYLESPILLPPTIDEQERITDVLDALDRELDLLAALRDQIDVYKRALLSRLLSGELKVPA